MLEDEAEVRLGYFRRVLLVKRYFVHQLTWHGPVEVRRRGGVMHVPSRLVHEITPELAATLTRELLQPGVGGFSPAFTGNLAVMHGFEGREQGLKNLLMSSYVMI